MPLTCRRSGRLTTLLNSDVRPLNEPVAHPLDQSATSGFLHQNNIEIFLGMVFSLTL